LEKSMLGQRSLRPPVFEERIVLPFRQVVEARNGCEDLAFMLRMMSRSAIRSVRTKGKERREREQALWGGEDPGHARHCVPPYVLLAS
jgi:hypothetical protein